MSKLTEFVHSAKSHKDLRLKKVIREFGAIGYGVYWVVIESLANELKNNFELHIDQLWIEDITYSFRLESEQYLLDVLDCFADIGLISKEKWNNKIIFSQDFIDQNSAQINLKRRQSQAHKYICHRDFIYARDNHECVYCGDNKQLSIDHVIPLVKGGTNDLSNLVTACLSCNLSKGAKSVDEWRQN